jgi:UPF0716 protein FxsA
MRTQKETAVHPRLGLFLLAALIGVPLLEIALFIKVGGSIGLGPTLALIVLTAVIGVVIMRWQGIGVMLRAQRQLAEGSLPVVEVFEGLCLVVAGGLLLIPGFFTDAVGALLLLPPVRRALYRQVRQRIEAHVVDVSARRAPAGPPRGPTIETDYEEILEQDRPMLGTDDREDQEMPPARGHWNRRP